MTPTEPERGTRGRGRLGVRIPPAADARAVAGVVARAEAYGWDTAWVGDSQLLWRDPFVTLALAAERTSRIRLGIAVTNVASRHVSVLASAIRTVGELAPGRFVVAVGAGNSSVRPVGLAPTPTRELARAFTDLRRLLTGEPVDFGVHPPARLRDPADVPLYLAATGPANLRLAGRLADGVLALCGTTPEAVRSVAGTVAAGAESAGRDPADVPIVTVAPCLPTADPSALGLLKPHAVTIAADGGRPRLAAAGITITDPGPGGWPDIYPDLLHAENQTEAVQACDALIDDASTHRFATQFTLTGPPESLRPRIASLHTAGATEIHLQHTASYDFPHDLLTLRPTLTP